MKKLCLLWLLSFFCISPLFSRTLDVAGGINTTADKRVRNMFMKGLPPFSFELDGRNSDEFIQKWTRRMVSCPASGDNERRYELVMKSPGGGLELRCDIVAYTDFPAVEWTLHFINTSSENSPRISGVEAANLKLAHKSGYTLYTAQGCHAIDRDFHLIKTEIEPDTTYRFVPLGGRPSSKTAFPFYNIATDAGNGVFFALGWTGNWFAQFGLDGRGELCLSSGMLKTDLFLYPGERIRTPLVSVLFWQGEDRMDGNNEFRRFVLAHRSPRGADGNLIAPPLCGGFDYGDPAPCGEYESFTELFAKAVIDRHRRFGIMPEVFWLDAGWYQGCNAPQSNFEGRNWFNTVGSWVADTSRFPGGLKAIADEVHRNGAKFMVWFEPERVYKGSIIDREHPEWLLSVDDSWGSRLLDLGNPAACDYLSKYIGDFLEENGIDYYRQDFNVNPQVYWEHGDSAGRTGITEIRYVEGLYRYLDYLRTRFPDMLIDNCASGGRRFDMEMIARSMPLWRTDCHYGEPNCQQCHEYGLSQFLPLHGTGIYYADKYCARSGMSSAYAWFGEVFNRQNSVMDMRHSIATYKELRHYFLCDFYPLSGDGDITGNDKWIAWQFHDTSDSSGIVQVFRRAEASQSQYTVALRGLDKNTLYDVYNEDNGITVQLTGEQLASELLLTLPSARTSVLLRYKPAQ